MKLVDDFTKLSRAITVPFLNSIHLLNSVPFKYISYPVFIWFCVCIFLLCYKKLSKTVKLISKNNPPYTSKQPLMMAYEGSESARDNFGKFIDQFQPETKTLIRELERIFNKLYRQNLSLLFNETCLNERQLAN